jgi:hypothetical protein
MRRPRALLPILLALAAAAPAGAQTIVTSARPDDVDVTIYRAPGRPPGTAPNLEWLNGYALISETRRVTIPAGESEVRFEGVAGGILPQSAIVTGFPEGIVERNRDAYLLSATSLIDRSLGRRVHLRRTSRATGAVREQDAVIRSGADGALVLQTADGFEALRCTGLNETPIFNEVPAGLSARPTLSVRTRARQPVTATVTLSYLSSGFDWQANYIATVSADGAHVDLFAWLTLASMDETSFPDADTQAVAGRLNRQYVAPDRPQQEWLRLRCWPARRTSDIPLRQPPEPQTPGRARRPNLEVMMPMTSVTSDDISVTGMARQEDLGDLKLYRLPEPVTVAAHSQKQVAFLRQPGVRTQLVYRTRIETDLDGHEYTPRRVLVTRNRPEEGLGVPLPAGAVQLFTAAADGRPMLLGEASIRDLAVGEDVEIEMGEAAGVTAVVEEIESNRRGEVHRLTVTNDHAVPVRYEAEFEVGEDERFRPRARLPRRHGRPLWAVTVPANGTASLDYRVTSSD